MSKVYGVVGGRDGPRCIYLGWDQTSSATRGVKGCKMKSFASLDECIKWIGPDHAVVLRDAKRSDPPLAEAYADGGCLANGSDHAEAGVGVYFGPEHPQNISMRLPGAAQSNQRAELLAALLAVVGAPRDADFTIFTDSQYTINASTEWFPRWVEKGCDTYEKSPNIDLIRLLNTAMRDKPRVKLEYVPGHQGIAGNEAADKLASAAISKKRKIV